MLSDAVTSESIGVELAGEASRRQAARAVESENTLRERPGDIQQALGTKRQSVPIDEQGNVALGLESGYVGTPAKSALC